MTTQPISKTQINKIARATKDYCAYNGYGQQIVVFRDGTWSLSHGDNDVIARGDGRGGWEYPIMRLRTPKTRAAVAEMIADALEYYQDYAADGAAE